MILLVYNVMICDEFFLLSTREYKAHYNIYLYFSYYILKKIFLCNTAGFNLKDSQFLVGYIQVTGPKFYRDICPNEKREEWFAQFKSKEDYKVYT